VRSWEGHQAAAVACQFVGSPQARSATVAKPWHGLHSPRRARGGILSGIPVCSSSAADETIVDPSSTSSVAARWGGARRLSCVAPGGLHGKVDLLHKLRCLLLADEDIDAAHPAVAANGNGSLGPALCQPKPGGVGLPQDGHAAAELRNSVQNLQNAGWRQCRDRGRGLPGSRDRDALWAPRGGGVFTGSLGW
jgi:hypothetical protein